MLDESATAGLTSVANSIGHILVEGSGHTITVQQSVGLSFNDFEALLLRREEQFVVKLAGLNQSATEDRALVERLLGETRNDLSDVRVAYDRQQQKLNETLATLNQLRERSGEDAVERARATSDTALAEGLLQLALRKQSKVTASLALRLRHLAMDRNDWQAAYEYACRAAEAEPQDTVAQHELGRLAFQLGKVDEAEDHFRGSLAGFKAGPIQELTERGLGPQSVDYRFLDLAEVLLIQHKRDEAVDIIRPYATNTTFLQQSPRFVKRLRQLGKAGTLDLDGFKLPSPVDTEDPSTATGLNNQGQAVQLNGNAHQAVALYQKALTVLSSQQEQNPLLCGIIHINMATAYDELGQTEDAEHTWQIARDVLGDSHPYIANSQFTLGISSLKRGDYAVTVRRFESLLRYIISKRGDFCTESVNVRQRLIQAYVFLGDIAAALVYQRELMRAADERRIPGLSPGDVDMLRTNLASLEADEQQRAAARH